MLRPPRVLCAAAFLLALGIAWAAAPPPAHAYVGPGAGFALVGSFMTMLLGLLGGLFYMSTFPIRFAVRFLRRRKALKRARVKRMVILGLDGLDPNLAERWMADGHLPELERLAKNGSFTRLRTTYPSISPVAWSSFMTGVDPARHNIFDFLNRDLRTYKPALSSSQVGGASRTLRVGNWLIPLGRAAVRNMRKSRAFWSILGEHRVPCNILRVPLTFPPERFAGALLSAMCVPDLRGTQGSFTFYTADPEEAGAMEASPESSDGERHLVEVSNGEIRATLPGPDNSLRAQDGPVELPFTVRLDRARSTAELRIGGKKYRLKEREYSPWVPLVFKPAPGVRVHGIARFYVTKLDPFGLYVTPINIDPAKPALPISWPGFYSAYLARLIGEFATLGLAEDTWALNERVIDEEAFLQQTLDHHREREAMFFNALEKSREGVIACVFDGTDRLQHMFFRYLDADHPANRGKDVTQYKDVILDMYKRVDDMIRRVRARLRPDDHLLVISDHGFQSFKRGVNVNSWLHQKGMLHLKPGARDSGDWFENVDWGRTQAYAFGLGGIYINQKGREALGIVAPGEETRAVKRALIEGLTGLPDAERGEMAINDVFDNQEIHPSGPYRDNGPDLIVGYNRGYRASWEGAEGRVTRDVICDNTKSWSGDHCIDPRLVPGVLFSSRPIAADDPGIMDLAPTILTQFGVEVPAYMTGKALEVKGAA